MAKQDVIDAINATIVPNGNKAINADSLRNLLLMMAENGGGASAYNVILKVAEMGAALTAEEKANNAAIYAVCEECYNNGTPLPIIMCDLSALYEVMAGERMAYSITPSDIIFTPTESANGLVGLCMLVETLSGTCVMSSDGTITIIES